MQKSLKASQLARKKSFGILEKEITDWKRENGGGLAANSPAYKKRLETALNILKNSDNQEDRELLRKLKIHAALTTGEFNRIGVQ